MLNFPNLLTLSRVFLAGLLMFLLRGDSSVRLGMALFCFVLACLTDYYDGRYARQHGQITFFGQLMDPIADKALVFSALLSFVEMDILPAWMVLVMLTREVFITAFRFVALSQNIVLPAENHGKNKTVLQSASIIGIMTVLICAKSAWWNPAWAGPTETVVYGVMLVVTVFTLWSGATYAVKYWKRVGGASTP